MAAPCAHLQLVRGPARKASRGRPFNAIVRHHSPHWLMAPAPTIRTLVLVEGDSDAAAIRALADRIGCDLGLNHIQICSAAGVTNYSRVLADFVRTHPAADFCGMYDVADEQHVRRALANAVIPIAAHVPLESFGFFACVADLEDELIRALGAEAVERVLEAQAELKSFRRFQAMPQHRLTPVHHQLRRFLGTRATRKIRSAQRLVEALDLTRLPHPLVQLAAKLREAAHASTAPQ